MKGVTKIPEQYKARVRFLGRTTHIGCFPTEEIALKIVADIQAAIDRFEEEAKKMLPDMLEKAIQKHTAPTRRADPTPSKPTRRADPTPSKPTRRAKATMPKWLYGIDGIHYDAKPAPKNSVHFKGYQGGVFGTDETWVNIGDVYPLQWNPETPDRLYLFNGAANIATDDYKGYLDGTLSTPVESKLTEVSRPSEEPEIYMLQHAYVRAKVPLFEYDPATGVAEDPKTKTLHDTKQFESHMNTEYDPDHIYWVDPKTDKFVFKTVND